MCARDDTLRWGLCSIEASFVILVTAEPRDHWEVVMRKVVHPSGALVAAASLLLLTACTPIVASGPSTSERREIDAVTTVVLDTSGDLVISQGEPALDIHAPEDVLPRLTSDVDGETLVLGSAPGSQILFGDIRYDLTLPDLETIELNGSGDIDATVSAGGTIRVNLDGSGDIAWTDLETGRVEITVAGSGDVELAGTATELAIQIDGSGSVDADDLQTQTAVVSIGGSGSTDVSVRDTLTVDIAGSGRVSYSGDPSVNSEVTGSGEVVRE